MSVTSSDHLRRQSSQPRWCDVTYEHVAERYAEMATCYHLWGWLFGQRRWHYARTAQIACPHSESHVYLIGCGPGHSLAHYSARAKTVVATDICKTMASLAEARVRGQALKNVIITCYNAVEHPPPLGATSIVFEMSYCVMPITLERLAFLEMCWYLLPDYGRLVIYDARIRRKSRWTPAIPLISRVMFNTFLGNPHIDVEDEVRRIVGRSGDVEIEQVGLAHYILVAKKKRQ